VADDGDTVPELDETNNVRVAAVAIGITRPELVVTALTGPAKAGTGQRITLNTTVRNTASPPATAGPFTVGLYLSDSATFDSSTALLLGRRTVSSLAGGGVSSGGTTVTVPAGLTDGAYFLFAVADDGAAVIEADEGNNVFAAASPLVVVRPDLAIGTASASVTPARLVTVSAIIQNGVTPGAAPAFAVGIYLSPTAEFDPGTARLLHRRPLTGLAGGARTTVQATLPIPGDVPAGAQFVVVVADDGDAVPESNETNNVRVVTPEITVVPAELIMTAVSGPVAAGAGGAIPVVTTMRNLGAWAAPPFTIGIYLSPTASFDLSSSRLLGGPRLRGLGAGVTHTATTSVTVPPDVVTGTYFLVAVADADNEMVETTRANNVMVASRVIEVSSSSKSSRRARQLSTTRNASPNGSWSGRISPRRLRLRNSVIESMPSAPNRPSRSVSRVVSSATIRRALSGSRRATATPPTCGRPPRPVSVPPPRSRQ